MGIRPIKNLAFSRKSYPDVIDAVNELARLEERYPHDSARRVLLDGCRERIRVLRSSSQSACAG